MDKEAVVEFLFYALTVLHVVVWSAVAIVSGVMRQRIYGNPRRPRG